MKLKQMDLLKFNFFKLNLNKYFNQLIDHSNCLSSYITAEEFCHIDAK